MFILPDRKQKRSTKSTSPSSDAPPCKTAPKGAEAKTPLSAGQRSSTAPVASTSYDVTPTPAETEPSGETVPTPPTVSPTREHTQGRVSPNPACSTPCIAEVSNTCHRGDYEYFAHKSPVISKFCFLGERGTFVQRERCWGVTHAWNQSIHKLPSSL